MTVDGYKRIFDDCENISDAFVYLQTLYSNFTVGSWRDHLERNNLYMDCKELFDYIEDLQKRDISTNPQVLIKAIEVFVLLESVLRNTLCRSYVPAYRTINTDCGRYRCYIEKREEQLFK